MNTRYILMITVIAFLMSGCWSKRIEEHADQNTTETVEETSNVIVLCDVSNSVSLRNTKDSATYFKRISAMSKSCSDIIRHYPAGSHIRIYTLSANLFTKPFFDLLVPEAYQRGSAKFKREYRQRDIDISIMLDSISKREGNSCILTSIEQACNTLSSDNPDGKVGVKNELIIFSDMLEHCDAGPVGSIRMNQDSKFNLLARDRIDTLQSYYATTKYADLGLKIRVVMSTPYMDAKLGNDIKNTWGYIFKRFCTKPSAVKFESDPKFERLDEFL